MVLPMHIPFLPTIVLLTGIAMASTTSAAADSTDVWIGTGSHQLSRGIYHCTLDLQSGQLSDPRLVAEVRGPGFLTRHPTLACLYAVGTLNDVPSVIAYRIERSGDGPMLELLNSAAIGDGGGTCLSVDATGRTILTAQYGGGSTAAFALNADGSIKEQTQLLKHKGGSKVVAGRQDAPHAHWVGFSPDNRYAFVPDLGLDQVVIYAFDADRSRITPHGAGEAPPGGGPRHMKFHPNGKWIYVLNELDLTVCLFDYDAAAGTMTPKQTIPAVPKEDLAKERFTSASEIRVHPNGRYVYSANRGHDTITAFRVDDQTGELTVIEREFVRGATPRNFNLDPSGRWLLAAGQDSHTLGCFEITPETGELTWTGHIAFAPNAICVVIE